MKSEASFEYPQEGAIELMNKIVSRWLYKAHLGMLVSKMG